jgi:hypothetical protein
VNFGRGASLLKTQPQGDDLILIFEGAGNGITADHFVGKLLGITRDQKMLFGYTRLPGVDYLEACLSARAPVFTKTDEGCSIAVNVKNYGQAASETATIRIEYNPKEPSEQGEEIATGKVPPLQPYEECTVELHSGFLSKEIGLKQKVRTIIDANTGHLSVLVTPDPQPPAKRKKK